jgi:adenylate kinase
VMLAGANRIAFLRSSVLLQTCTCAAVAEATGLRHINVGDVVRKEQCHEGRDADFDAFILDEDKLIDAMRADAEAGGCVVDFHSCDVFPEDWFDLVLVLRADTKVSADRPLFDRVGLVVLTLLAFL